MRSCAHSPRAHGKPRSAAGALQARASTLRRQSKARQQQARACPRPFWGASGGIASFHPSQVACSCINSRSGEIAMYYKTSEMRVRTRVPDDLLKKKVSIIILFGRTPNPILRTRQLHRGARTWPERRLTSCLLRAQLKEMLSAHGEAGSRDEAGGT